MDLDGAGQIWMDFDEFGRIWMDFDEFERISTELAAIGVHFLELASDYGQLACMSAQLASN